MSSSGSIGGSNALTHPFIHLTTRRSHSYANRTASGRDCCTPCPPVGRQGADHRLVQDEERKTSHDPSASRRSRTHCIYRAERIRLVLPIRKGPYKAG